MVFPSASNPTAVGRPSPRNTDQEVGERQTSSSPWSSKDNRPSPPAGAAASTTTTSALALRTKSVPRVTPASSHVDEPSGRSKAVSSSADPPPDPPPGTAVTTVSTTPPHPPLPGG